MRSSEGVGITPPNAESTAKSISSVMISRMLGAPLGGTTRAGQSRLRLRGIQVGLDPKGCCGGGTLKPFHNRLLKQLQEGDLCRLFENDDKRRFRYSRCTGCSIVCVERLAYISAMVHQAGLSP